MPPVDVADKFRQLVDSLSEEEDALLSEFIDYFEATWIGHERRGRYRPPLFQIKFWNVFDRVQDDLPRTNNSVEGWHNAFNRRVSIPHPTFRRLVKKIQQEQGGNEVFIRQLACGFNGSPMKKRYTVINERLKMIVNGYSSTSPVIPYLRAIAHNL